MLLLAIGLGFVGVKIVTLAGKDKGTTSAAPGGNLAVDFGPECDKVIHRRDDRHQNHEPNREVGDQVDGKDETADIPGKPLMIQDGRYDTYDLNHHFQLP